MHLWITTDLLEVSWSPALCSYLRFIWFSGSTASCHAKIPRFWTKTAWSFPQWSNTSSLSSFFLPSLPLTLSLVTVFLRHPLFMFFSVYLITNACFFFQPSSITLAFKDIWMLLSNSVALYHQGSLVFLFIFVLKPQLLHAALFCHLSLAAQIVFLLCSSVSPAFYHLV